MKITLIAWLLGWMLWGGMSPAAARMELSDNELDAVTAGIAGIANLDGVIRFDVNRDIEFHRNPRLNVFIEGKPALALSEGLLPERVWTLSLGAGPERPAVADLNAFNYFFPLFTGVERSTNSGPGISPLLDLFRGF